ncbi:MAG: LOG family protein, partial [Anaerolineales bacterium]|nr:LOG family protein [Anaerolineales bacterium]
EIRYRTLLERMAHLVAKNDGIIALSGSVGTLAEVALAWNQLLVNVIPPRPFILLGEQWRRILDVFLAYAPVTESHRALVQLADTPEEAVALVT